MAFPAGYGLCGQAVVSHGLFGLFGRVMDCVRTSLHYSDKSRPSHGQVVAKLFIGDSLFGLAVCIMVSLWPGRADIEGSKSNVAMNAWLPQASYPCGNFSDTSSFKFRRSKGSIGHAFTMCRPSQTPHLTMSSARIDPPKRVLGLKEGVVTPPPIHGLAVRRPGKAPERAVPSPSPGRHEAVRSRHVSSSSSPPTVDGFGTGTPEPSPQSQSFSQSYGSILPTSLAYIVPSTRGCSPWRPDAVMSTTGRERHSVLRIFKGRRECTGHHATCGALPAAGPYLRLSRFQGGQAVKQKR
ncbi:hypothetical protein YC2023_003561 [Brassica napus]